MALEKKQKKDIDYCAACPKLCRHACPVGNAECRETVSPWGKMTALKQVDDGLADLNAENSALFYKCLGCLLCRSYCELGVEVPESLVGGRTLATARGVAPPCISEIKSNFDRYKNAAGVDLSARISALLPSAYFEKGVSAVFFAGCVHTERDPSFIKKFFGVSKKLGVDYLGAWGGEPFCCGLPLYNSGYESEFAEHAAALATRLSAYKMVVTACPACAYALKVMYPQKGIIMSPKVLHAVEFLLLLLEGRTLRSTGKTLAYHDPCYLGRYLGQYDEPRALLEKCGVKVAEFQWNRENSYCCGGGGNVPLTSPTTAAAISGKRRAEFANTKAQAIATACPSCEAMLRLAGADIQVVDVIDVLNEALS